MSRSIVLVDDAEDVHLLARALVRRAGLDVELHSARDGKQGLELVRRVSPDLVLTDVNMPHMGGLEMIDALEAEGQTPRVVLIGGTSEIPATHPAAFAVVDKQALFEDLPGYLSDWLP